MIIDKSMPVTGFDYEKARNELPPAFRDLKFDWIDGLPIGDDDVMSANDRVIWLYRAACIRVEELIMNGEKFRP